MSMVEYFNDDFGVPCEPRYFSVTPKEYEKLTSECPGGGGNIDPEQKEVTYTENGVNVVDASGTEKEHVL